MAAAQPPAVVLRVDAAALPPESVPQVALELHASDEHPFAEQSFAARAFQPVSAVLQCELWPQEHPQVLPAWHLLAARRDAAEQLARPEPAC